MPFIRETRLLTFLILLNLVKRRVVRHFTSRIEGTTHILVQGVRTPGVIVNRSNNYYGIEVFTHPLTMNGTFQSWLNLYTWSLSRRGTPGYKRQYR